MLGQNTNATLYADESSTLVLHVFIKIFVVLDRQLIVVTTMERDELRNKYR